MAPQPPGSEEGDPDQWWFWTDEWQAREREADADREAGRIIRHDSDEAFRDALVARLKPGGRSWKSVRNDGEIQR
jgi:hypothetical protein